MFHTIIPSLMLALGACEQQHLVRPGVPTPEAPVPSASEGSPGDRLLREPIRLAQAAGAGEATIQREDFLAEGDRLGIFLAPPADACLLVMAKGTDTVEDLDLLVFDDEGAPLAMDEAPDPFPTVLLCPPLPERMYVMLRGMAGRGLVALSTQPVPLSAALRIGRAFHARVHPGFPRQNAEAWPGLDEKITLIRRTTGGQWQERRRVILPAEARAPGYLTETIDAGRCLLWMATPSEETSEIDGQLLDHEGRSIGRMIEIERERFGLVCSSSSTSTGIQLRPRIGSGIIAVVIAHSIPGTEADLNLHPERLELAPIGPPHATMATISSRLKTAGYGVATTQLQGEARVGQMTALPLTIGSECTRIDLVGGAPLFGLTTSLWTEQGELLAQNEGGAHTTLFSCGVKGRMRLEIEANHRPGPFLVEVREEPLATLPPSLAASRLLARYNSEAVVRPTMLENVQRQAITTNKAAQGVYNLPAHQCVEIGAALEEGGSGLELRIFETSSREERGRGSAKEATVVPICASEHALNLQIEARLLAGQSTVLTATRTVTKK